MSIPEPKRKLRPWLVFLTVLMLGVWAVVYLHGRATGEEAEGTYDELTVPVEGGKGQVEPPERSRLPAVGLVALSMLSLIMVRRTDT